MLEIKNLHAKVEDTPILRGIDPKTISDVTDLGKNMTHGDLDYLAHPERILDSSISTKPTGALDAMIEDAERAAAKGLPDEAPEDGFTCEDVGSVCPFGAGLTWAGAVVRWGVDS